MISFALSGKSILNYYLSMIRHASEIKKLKEVTTAAEKMRREKWIEQKTKEIKVQENCLSDIRCRCQ